MAGSCGHNKISGSLKANNFIANYLSTYQGRPSIRELITLVTLVTLVTLGSIRSTEEITNQIPCCYQCKSQTTRTFTLKALYKRWNLSATILQCYCILFISELHLSLASLDFCFLFSCFHQFLALYIPTFASITCNKGLIWITTNGCWLKKFCNVVCVSTGHDT